MNRIPTFRTERLLLRPVEESDAVEYERHFVDYEVIRHLAAPIPWPYPKSGSIDFIRSEVLPHQGLTKWFWAINLKEQPDKLIGMIELLREASPTNRGFWLGKAHWGKGYMTEALEPITDFAFGPLGFERLVFGNAVGNNRSRRIKEKTGAIFVKKVPAQYMDPTFTHKEIFELTKEAWLSRSADS
ncbi:MAG: GNAT family N-acetyltransferase [Bdellovibrionales bacterium]|nr:GNAT family N-acetyltransferase [Bdellovibrionales bacterium]